MTDAVSFSPEQFEKLLATIKEGREPVQQTGLGGLPFGVTKKTGLGCGGGGCGGASSPIMAGVFAMLAAGSPRLALAKAYGVPLAPFIINVRAEFPDVDTFNVPDRGSDVKIVQDTLIDALVIRVTLDNPALNILQPISDYFFNFQSGLEATLDVQGAPRYTVAENFTPLSTLADMVNGNSHWPAGWVLTYQQQLFMSFNARIQLPDSPATVVATYRGWVPTSDMFVGMSTREAVTRLRDDCGIDCGEAYIERVCR